MREERLIGNYWYAVSFKDNEFKFYIDTRKSKNRLEFLDEISLRFGDVPIDSQYGTTSNKEFMTVFGFVRGFVDSVVKNQNPHYFYYVANQPEKINLYSKFSLYISNKYDYYVDVSGNKFSFYKKRNYD